MIVNEAKGIDDSYPPERPYVIPEREAKRAAATPMERPATATVAAHIECGFDPRRQLDRQRCLAVARSFKGGRFDIPSAFAVWHYDYERRDLPGPDHPVERFDNSAQFGLALVATAKSVQKR